MLKGREIDERANDRCKLQSIEGPKGGNARWGRGKVMRGGNGRFRAEVAGDPSVG